MPRFVALLRGVNVGGRNRLAMADLRALFESLGFAEVATYIQSGNVIFSAARTPSPEPITRALEAELGLDAGVVVRSAVTLARALEANPFSDAAPARLHLCFLARRPARSAVGGLEPGRFLPERYALRGAELYLDLPHGMGRAKIPGYLERRLAVPLTARNWNTVVRLVELAGA